MKLMKYKHGLTKDGLTTIKYNGYTLFVGTDAAKKLSKEELESQMDEMIKVYEQRLRQDRFGALSRYTVFTDTA